MNTYDTAKTIRDLVEYYCFRCNVGLCDCKISAVDCLKISSDRDFKEVTKPQTLADRKTEPTISKMEQVDVDKDINVRSKDEPQTDCHWK